MKKTILRSCLLVCNFFLLLNLGKAQEYIDVLATSDGNLLVIEETSTKYYLVKFNGEGFQNQIWRTEISNKALHQIKANNLVELDDGYVVAESEYQTKKSRSFPAVKRYHKGTGRFLSKFSFDFPDGVSRFKIDALCRATNTNNDLIVALNTDKYINILQTDGFSKTLKNPGFMGMDENFLSVPNDPQIGKIIAHPKADLYYVTGTTFSNTTSYPFSLKLNPNLDKLAFDKFPSSNNFSYQFGDAQISDAGNLFVSFYKKVTRNNAPLDLEYILVKLRPLGSKNYYLLENAISPSFAISCDEEIAYWRMDRTLNASLDLELIKPEEEFPINRMAVKNIAGSFFKPAKSFFKANKLIWVGKVSSGLGTSPYHEELTPNSVCNDCIPDQNGAIYVTNTRDEGVGSLRWALECAQNTSVALTIAFDLPNNVNFIQPQTKLPAITKANIKLYRPINCDQAGDAHYIIIDGSQIDDSHGSGLLLKGAHNFEMEGIILQNFPKHGMDIEESLGVRIGKADPSGQAKCPMNIFRDNGYNEEAALGAGLTIAEAPDFNIINNLFQDNAFAGLYLIDNEGEEAKVAYNVATGNKVGFYLFFNQNTLLEGNTLNSNNNKSVISPEYGDFLIVENIASNTGIHLGRNCNQNTLIRNRILNHDNHAIAVFRNSAGNHFSQNSMICNLASLSQSGNIIELIDSTNANNNIPAPIITKATDGAVLGTAVPGSKIEIFINLSENIINQDTSQCRQAPCQGSTYIGHSFANEEGEWALSANNMLLPIRGGMLLTALASNTNNSTSEFSDCVEVIVQETVCDYGGQFISRDYEYSGTIDNNDVFPSAIQEVVPLYPEFFGKLTEPKSQTFIYKKITDIESALKVRIEATDMEGGGMVDTAKVLAFVFSCQCDTEDFFGDPVCGQTFLGSSKDKFFDEHPINDTTRTPVIRREIPQLLNNTEEDDGQESGLYFVVVVSDENLETSFELRVSEGALEEEGPCAFPLNVFLPNSSSPPPSAEISAGTGRYQVGDAIYDQYTGPYPLDGTEKTYRLVVSAFFEYQFDFSSLTNERLTFMLHGQICGEEILLQEDLDASRNHAQSTIQLSPGVYTIIIDSDATVQNNPNGPHRFDLRAKTSFLGYPTGFFNTDQFCDVNNPDFHEIIFSNLDNSTIDSVRIDTNDQIFVEYLNINQKPTIAGIRQWNPNAISNNVFLPFNNSTDTTQAKCGFNEGEDFLFRLHRSLEGRFYSLDPNFESDLAPTQFRINGKSIVDSVAKDQNVKVSVLNVASQAKSFRADGGVYRITIYSSENWYPVVPESDEDWLTTVESFGPTGKILEAFVEPNLTPEERTGFIFINLDNGLRYAITITQNTFCPDYEITLSQDTFFVCDTNAIMPMLNVTEDLSYRWTDAAGNPVGNTLKFNPTDTGTYNFYAENTNYSFCNVNTNVLVLDSPLELSVVDLIHPCADGNLGEVRLGVENESGTPQYNWSNGDTGQLLSSVGIGTYSATVTDELGCTDTLSISLDTIMANPTLVGPTDEDAMDGYILLAPSGVSENYTITWVDSPIATDSIGNLGEGDYAFEIIDASGCTFRDTLTLESIGLSISGGPENSEHWTKIDEGVLMKLFPNPASAFVQLEVLSAKEASLEYHLYNSLGKRIKGMDLGKLQHIQEKIDLQNLAEGTYLLQLIIDGQRFNTKIIHIGNR